MEIFTTFKWEYDDVNLGVYLWETLGKPFVEIVKISFAHGIIKIINIKL